MTDREDQEETAPEKLIHAYDRMLERAEHALGSAAAQPRAVLTRALEAARENAIELGELTREEADRIHEFVTRDLHDVGRHLSTEERDLADWLRIGLLVIEKEVLNRFTALAETARLEFRHLEKARARLGEWHTGEVTTIGTLRCRKCGELIHFKHTGHIPPCPKCRATVYSRARV